MSLLSLYQRLATDPLLGGGRGFELAPSPRSVVHREGTAVLYRFHGGAAAGGRPLLLVPSLINRWYVLDLRAGASVVEALVGAGIDVYAIDWGVPADEDRYTSWDDVVGRLRRMVRRVQRHSGSRELGLLGYCMGGTLAAIHTALHPDEIAALVNLLGPIDFSRAGLLRELVDPAHFDAGAIADAGNVPATQMQSGFVALRPTADIAKRVGAIDRRRQGHDLDGFYALEAWAADNVPFPGEAYRTYIGELYQQNRLVAGEHRALGRRVDLAAIRCPVLTIVAERDTICPPAAATALGDLVSSSDTSVLAVAGGHVGAVVGSRAARDLYPALTDWLRRRLGAPRSVPDAATAAPSPTQPEPDRRTP